MQRRIGLWALCGAAVALMWASVFYLLGPSVGRYPSQFALLQYLGHSLLLTLSVTLGLLGRHWAISWYLSAAINAATYALAGLFVELMRLAFSHWSHSARPLSPNGLRS